MPGMKVTVDAAMRARDVSRAQPHHDAAAEAAIADVPTLRSTPGTRITPAPAPATATPQPPRPAPPRPRPGPPVPGPANQPAPRHSAKPAPPPRPAVAPEPAPAQQPIEAPYAAAAELSRDHEPESHQAEPPSAAQEGRDADGAPGSGRDVRSGPGSGRRPGASECAAADHTGAEPIPRMLSDPSDARPLTRALSRSRGH